MERLLCHTTGIMVHGEIFAIEGKRYPVLGETPNEIVIASELGRHFFNKETYNEWFEKLVETQREV